MMMAAMADTADTAAKPVLSKRQRTEKGRGRDFLSMQSLAVAKPKKEPRKPKKAKTQDKSSVIAAAIAAVRAQTDIREKKRKAARSPRWTDVREPVEMLADAGLIQRREAKAGSRLYAEWVASGGIPQSTFNWGRLVALVQTSGKSENSSIDARKSVTKALRAVGIILSPVLVHVCLLPQMLPKSEEELKMLKEALRVLADHYDASRMA